MAFCNSCGNNLESGAKFCSKCGTVQAGANIGSTPVAVPPHAATPNNSLRIILIVVGAVILLGVISVAAITVIGLRIARHTRVENRDGNVRIESPFGDVETTNDPAQIAASLGVNVYPGARVLEGNAADVTVAGMHTISAEFETEDSPDKVAEFYKSKFPNPNVSNTAGGETTIVSTSKKNLITITIEPEGSKTRIHIANVSGKGVTSGSGA